MLVLEKTGQPVLVGHSYPIVKGVLSKSKDANILTVAKIIPPSPEQPDGLLWVNINNEGIPSRQEYVPSVIGAVWKAA